MNCEKVSLFIEEFYDGELDSRLQSRIKQHLAACPSCSADFEMLVRIDRQLEKSSAPPAASATLERKLTEAFRRRDEKALKSPAWWRRAFVGSVSIPKPALGAAALASALAGVALGVGLSTRGVSSGVGPPALGAKASASPPVGPAPLPPVVNEGAKVIEAPVVRERVVTRVVYVERRGGESAARRWTGVDKAAKFTKRDDPTPSAGGAVEGGEYVTRANLSGFQPVAELKTRIIPDR